MAISVKNINKRFEEYTALDNVSLDVKTGELIALLGPSGSGKTTLLRIIAGLEFPDSGNVILNGEVTGDKDIKERHVGFVFQHYALFKHMTVFENVAFGLRVRPKHNRPTEYHIRRKIMELLSLVHLEAFHDRYPSQLSGGQRQRVALARALAVEPRLLLLDEPFGALDSKVRKELRRWMRRLHDDIHITSIFVTHDQEEAMEVADRVVVMSNGKIEQVGTPEEVYHSPANAFVYDFLGNYNEFAGFRSSAGKIILEGFDSGKSKAKKKTNNNEDTDKVKALVRPYEIYVAKKPEDNEFMEVKVIHINHTGSLIRMELESKNKQLIQAEISKHAYSTLKIQKNDKVFIKPEVVKVFE